MRALRIVNREAQTGRTHGRLSIMMRARKGGLMSRLPDLRALAGFALLFALACASHREEPAPQAATPPAPPTLAERIHASTLAVDDARLRNADADPANWLTHGRTY